MYIITTIVNFIIQDIATTFVEKKSTEVQQNNTSLIYIYCHHQTNSPLKIQTKLIKLKFTYVLY